MEKEFLDKVVIVTGGTRGIGKQIADSFLKEGAKVIVIHSGSKEIRDKNEKIKYISLNVSDFKKSKEIIAEIFNEYKKINVLVNNAGITKDKLVLSMEEDDFDKVIDVNLKGTFNMLKHVYPIMMKQKSGKIINISSVVALTGNKGQANYVSSKAGVIGLTKTISKELASRNINCNAIAPGFIKTEMTDVLKEEVKKKLIDSIPMKRMGKAEDIANLTLFLASEKASYITGQVIVCDGGLIS